MSEDMSNTTTELPAGPSGRKSILVHDAVAFLTEAARYFESRPTDGEDRAYWANVYNAENCRLSVRLITTQKNALQRCVGELVYAAEKLPHSNAREALAIVRAALGAKP